MVRLRLGLPSLGSISFNPPTIPGGLGASSTGTITLSAPAPASGANINVSITQGTAISFSATTNATTTTVTIAPGATTGTFTVYSLPVSQNTQCLVSANLQGSVVTAGITVVPWLQNLQLAPTTLVGGNTVNGTITLSAAAPTGGVTVSLGADMPTLVGFPTGGVDGSGGSNLG